MTINQNTSILQRKNSSERNTATVSKKCHHSRVCLRKSFIGKSTDFLNSTSTPLRKFDRSFNTYYEAYTRAKESRLRTKVQTALCDLGRYGRMFISYTYQYLEAHDSSPLQYTPSDGTRVSCGRTQRDTLLHVLHTAVAYGAPLLIAARQTFRSISRRALHHVPPSTIQSFPFARSEVVEAVDLMQTLAIALEQKATISTCNTLL